MVNTLRMFRYLLVIALFALMAMLTMVGCEEEYTPTGTQTGLAPGWSMFDTEVDATQIRSAAFLTADKGFFVGCNGAVLSTSDGGTTWQQIDRQAGGTLWDIEFTGDTGLIVGDRIGDDATILRSIDGGTTWGLPIVGSGVDDLHDVDLSNENFTWAVGSSGLVILSTNAGWEWSRFLPMETIDTTIDTSIINPDSSLIDTAIDTSFIPIGNLGSYEDLYGVSFANIGSGIVVGADGKISFTTDTAQTWADATSNPAVGDLNDVFMLSAVNAIAVGNDGTVLRTTDGGAIWTAIDIVPEDNLYSVEFSGTSVGWITGANGVILTTADGGANWTVQNSDTHLDLWDASFVSTTAGWIAGDFTIMNTATGGTTWTIIKSKTTDLPTLHAVDFFDENHGWVVGDAGTIVSTDDGGTSWLLLQHRDDFWLSDVQFISATEGWAVGGRGVEPYNALIQHTDDGGLTWTNQTNWAGVVDTFRCSSIDTSWIHAVDMIDATTGYAVGGKWTTATGGLIIKTADGGTTWTALNVISDTMFTPVEPGDPCHPGQTLDTVIVNRSTRFHGTSFVDATTGYAVGMSGIIVKTTDGGDTWTWLNTQYFYTEFDDITAEPIDSALVSGGYLFYDLTDVYFADASTGWAIGTADSVDVNVVLYTTDGGTTWTRQNIGSGVDMNDIAFSDAANGWIVGTAGIGYITSDGGLTWTEIDTNVEDLLGVKPLSSSSAWVVGESGLLIKTTSGGQ